MKITEYYDIYVRFLSKVEDEYLASLGDEEIHKNLYPLMLKILPECILPEMLYQT